MGGWDPGFKVKGPEGMEKDTAETSFMGNAPNIPSPQCALCPFILPSLSFLSVALEHHI